MKIKSVKLNYYIDAALLLFLFAFPCFASAFRVEMMGKIIAFIIFAVSLDLIWGYTGLLSMGHAVMFGLGAYITGLSAAFQNGVPKFMIKCGLTEIPFFLKPLQNQGLAFLLAILIPGIFAGILGVFLFSSKVNGVFFTLITLALSSVFATLFNSLQKYTGGFNGITAIPRPTLFGDKLEVQQLYYLTAVILVLVYCFCRWLTGNRFGKIITSVRDNEPRLQFLGYNPAAYKIAIYVISGMLAGLAGMLYAPFNSCVTPSDLGMGLSTSVIIWLAIGGTGNITGAIAGALLVNWSESLLSEYTANYWQLILGIVILLFVLFVPNGIIGKLLNMQYEMNTRTAEKPVNLLIHKRRKHI